MRSGGKGTRREGKEEVVMKREEGERCRRRGKRGRA